MLLSSYYVCLQEFSISVYCFIEWNNLLRNTIKNRDREKNKNIEYLHQSDTGPD